MKFGSILLPAAILLICNVPQRAESAMPHGQCHDVDLYGIYRVCDEPLYRRHEERPQAIGRPVEAIIPYSLVDPVPTSLSLPTSDNDTIRRDLATVDAKLHGLYLLLNDKQIRGEIETNLIDEEMRYLTQIERHEQSAAEANGGYLTDAQESALIRQLQDVEGEIDRILPVNG